ncbi:MAG: hypothetical protein COT56_13510, partial [Methylobacterium sp. CG09_land_8_20_14_0_10_71_15]
MHGRLLPPLQLHEFTAEVLEEAIEHHLGRLRRTAREERDKADRMAWALAERQRTALHSVWSWLGSERALMGAMPAAAVEDIDNALQRLASKMPRSAANADMLKAQRTERVKAEDARKAERRESRARHKRMMGLECAPIGRQAQARGLTRCR